MKRLLSVLVVCGFLVGAASWASAETSTVDGQQEAVIQLDAKTMRGLVKALLNPGTEARQVCVLDSFGHTWELTIDGPNITGLFYPACGYGSPWPVTGEHVGLDFDVTAGPNPDYACYCNTYHEFTGTVDIPSRTASGWAYAYGNCTGDAACDAGLCQ